MLYVIIRSIHFVNTFFQKTQKKGGRENQISLPLCFYSSAARSFFSALFSIRDTFRHAYCKRLALRNRFQLTEAEFDDDLFVFGQFHTLDEADQKLPAGVGRIQKLLHQLSCSVFCADRAFFL